jgi:hypothetical protein
VPSCVGVAGRPRVPGLLQGQLRWPACFAGRGITREAALCLRGRSQGSAALSGLLPRRPGRASSPAPSTSPGPREPSRPKATQTRVPGQALEGTQGPVSSSGRLGSGTRGRGWLSIRRLLPGARCRPSLLPGAAPLLCPVGLPGHSRRAAGEVARWTWPHCPPVASLPNSARGWAQCPHCPSRCGLAHPWLPEWPLALAHTDPTARVCLLQRPSNFSMHQTLLGHLIRTQIPKSHTPTQRI